MVFGINDKCIGGFYGELNEKHINHTDVFVDYCRVLYSIKRVLMP